MTRGEAGWVAAAAVALAASAGLAWWALGPSLGVRAQLQIDRAMEALARWAGDRAGVFPTPGELAEAAGAALPAADPWDRAWRYEREAPTGPVRLWSVGPDGVDARGEGDDLASWNR